MKAAERVTIQVKATEQYFIVVLFIVQYKVVLKPGQQYFTRWFSFSSVLQKQILSLFGVHRIVFVRRKEWKIYQWLNNNQSPERNEQSYLGRGHFPLSFSSSTYFTNTSLHRLRRTSRANSATLPSDWSAWRSTSGVPLTNENWRRVSKQDLANSSRRGNPFASVPVWNEDSERLFRFSKIMENQQFQDSRLFAMQPPLPSPFPKKDCVTSMTSAQKPPVDYLSITL